MKCVKISNKITFVFQVDKDKVASIIALALRKQEGTSPVNSNSGIPSSQEWSNDLSHEADRRSKGSLSITGSITGIGKIRLNLTNLLSRNYQKFNQPFSSKTRQYKIGVRSLCLAARLDFKSIDYEFTKRHQFKKFNVGTPSQKDVLH